MKIFVNSKNEIRDVDTNSLHDETLSELEVTDGTFDGWSKALICCYKVEVEEGVVIMKTPYVDSRMLYHRDQLVRETEALTPYTDTKTAYTGDTEITFYDVPSGNVSVYINGYLGNYAVNRIQDRLTVSFDELNDQTDITISIS
jgi:hypothetical protein